MLFYLFTNRPMMKKQVMLPERQRVRRLHQDDALQRQTGINDSRAGGSLNFHNGLKSAKLPAVRSDPQLQSLRTIHIPKTVTTATSLKHTELTPAQREYLCTIAATYSTAHVRDLISQHYMNVLHGCIRTDYIPEKSHFAVTPTTSPENGKCDEHQSSLTSRRKQKWKTATNQRKTEKSFLPKIPNRQNRLSTSAKHEMKRKLAPSSATVKGKIHRSKSYNPGGVREG
ncbi:uncharacterized protein LOC117532321 isoform X2 [Thalassophryne amazonica]|uniref:uncharacterized protein LOC117532321 isoform X2 n=1 Tax=Thalassophryne amazonica TaxID=390379 RepID=UPI0014713A0A|nr:uncharacterized protein LOC117532321 isoform X2 [Thalassophryne amazonica]